MTQTDQAWNTFSQLMRQFPLWPSTFSDCECGRSQARGGGKCAICLEEELAEQVGPEAARAAVDAMKAVQVAWAGICERSES